MSYRIHFRVTDGSKVYNAYRDMDYVPTDKTEFWVESDDGKFSGEIIVYTEMGIRAKDEDGKVKVLFSCFPKRYDD